MSEIEEFSTERPVLLGEARLFRKFQPRGGSSPRVELHNAEARRARINGGLDGAWSTLREQVALTESVLSSDPQLVLVLEAVDERIDLSGVAARVGLEIILEAEGSMEPDEDFQLIAEKPKTPLVGTCLHAVCVDRTALERLQLLWRVWERDQELPRNYAALRNLFVHLKDLRTWGPQDRLRLVDVDAMLDGMLEDAQHFVEIELWYRRTPRAREESQREVVALLEGAGGRFEFAAILPEIGYHGLRCSLPTSALRQLAHGDYAGVSVVRSASVMYLRAGGQALEHVSEAAPDAQPRDAPLPQGTPVVCLLDGMPAANHALLSGRVAVYDPDDFASEAEANERKHGTWMASVAVWGDLSAGEAPASRPVLVRPILVPSSETLDRAEELPSGALVPDLMERVFRELFEGNDDTPPAAPEVCVVNLSIGDPALQFDTIMSAWARAIDWLSYRYGVLVVVSAGNHPVLDLNPASSKQVAELSGADRRRAVMEAVSRTQATRRPLAPAEAINALTVGALHSDASESEVVGYVVDPADGEIAVSPVSAVGSGYRRSVKPDLLAAGGRVVFRAGGQPQDHIRLQALAASGPGVRVATPSPSGEAFIAGTSPAAALVAREAARLHDLVAQVADGRTLSRRQRAVAIKALLGHGASQRADIETAPFPPEVALGNGVLDRDYSLGCSSNEAVVLFLGSIGAAEEAELQVPLPDGLATRDVKEIEATLAWLSPVNWRHRQYRRASLTLLKPGGAIPALDKPTGLSAAVAGRGASTLQRLTWSTERAFGGGHGASMNVRVKCLEQAGGLHGEAIDFAVVLSLRVAAAAGVDVYTQVRSQLAVPVDVRPV